MRNGIYDFKNKSFEPHNPNVFFISRLEIDYDEKAFECNYFMRYLETTFTRDDGEPDRDTIKMILQIMAYFIYPKLKMEKMFFLGGEGSNGKSVFQSFLKNYFWAERIFFTIDGTDVESRWLYQSPARWF